MNKPLKYMPQVSQKHREPEKDKMTWEDYLADAIQAMMFVGVGVCVGLLMSIVTFM